MTLIVQKYGGTSVATPERITAVAARVATQVESGLQILVVVSAMGQTTDQLSALAHTITPRPEGREYDMLLASGELVSASLLALALRARGHPAIALSGPQAGVYTDDTFSRARITRIDTQRLRDELRKENLVIIAGFQGLSPDQDITTLGRGGSDTSALALAAALQSERVEIYTDVDGVFTTDPRLIPSARLLHDITYEEMLELAAHGAGVMHPRAVELGLLYDLPILVASAFHEEAAGTIIRKQVEMEPTNRVRGVALDTDVATLTVRAVPDRPGIAAHLFGPVADAGISVDTIVQNASVERLTDLTFSVAREWAKDTYEIVAPIADGLGAGAVLVDNHLAKVSIVGTGMQSGAGYAATMFRALAEEEINIHLITTSEIRITALIPQELGEKAVQILHTAFHLDRPPTDPS